MADNEHDNDEYKFAELDSLDVGPTEDFNSEPDSFAGQSNLPEKKDIKRNALIAIGLVVFLMIMYKLLGSLFFSSPSEPVPTQTVVPAITQTPAPVPTTVITPVPVQQVQQESAVSDIEKNLENKVSAIDVSQQTMRSELAAVSDQIDNINNNISNLNTQLANLNQVISTLSNQVAKQSETMNVVTVHPRPKKVKSVVHYMPQRIKYFIQAVIPGRAWLIGSNGSTITVREGTKIAGYGVIKLIDSIQGRILTSSGQVIRFSQEDS